MDIKEKVTERLLRYVRCHTQSSEESATTPSTPGQMEFARLLRDELEAMGLTEISLDENGYLFATLPANSGRRLPVVGFIAHLDTSPDMSGLGVKPRIVAHYDGGDIVLNEQQGIVLSPAQFPELLRHRGEDLVVTDGTTLLGADDKAGIAEIVTAIEYLQANPQIEHGKIRIGFNPDEEIGLGAHKFDVERFGCDWAYTLDGSEVGELEYENFNAASATIAINGRNVHPGYAKGKMLNALRLAAELIEALPKSESPESTEGYQGFYHPVAVKGGVDSAQLSLIIRDHSAAEFARRKQFVEELVAAFNARYGEGTLLLQLSDTYYNMRQKVEPLAHVTRLPCEAMRQVGVEPVVVPIRGGTDGAQLSFKGLPCPNLFAGGINFHSRYEFVPVQTMEKATLMIAKIAELTAKEF